MERTSQVDSTITENSILDQTKNNAW